jgi:hypothetical protein
MNNIYAVFRHAYSVNPNDNYEDRSIVYSGNPEEYTGGLGCFEDYDPCHCIIRRAGYYVVNLTPHKVTLLGVDFPPSGVISRCTEGRSENHHLLPVVQLSMGEILNLPEPKQDHIYIASRIVAEKAKRNDVFCPGDIIRNDEGAIVGCSSLCAF